jgi:lipoprotein NlpI
MDAGQTNTSKKIQTMGVTKIAFSLVMLCIAAPSTAQEAGSQLAGALEKFRLGDFNGALQQLDPVLQADNADPSTAARARELAAQVLHARGEQHFRKARIELCVADFERQIELVPGRAAEHWQLGIAYYYAGEYEKGARQFELHRTVNPQDVENAAWHFLCVVRAPKGSVEEARKTLIPVTHDERVPMAHIQQMFAGQLAPEEVLKAGEKTGGTAKFYADLYVGLYYEALGSDAEALRHIQLAAENPAAKDSYMGDVARVHVTLRVREQPGRVEVVPTAKTPSMPDGK